ncbi:MAG: 3-oxoacyl-ACP reductase FabG [Planctomycetes bacterium]|nr:3-oxoacyl-ACP reductase FabG [Planctomycetota bacterium]
MARWRASFDGETAVVTGGAAGIGLAIARALVDAGANVHVLDRQPPEGDARFRFHSVDLRSTASVDAAITAIDAETGRIDHLVNNAGLTRDSVLWKLDDEAWEDVLDVNLTGAFRCLRAVVPHMRRRNVGRIVQIASINGLRGKFGQANYSASKAGLIGLTRTAARELGRFGITVNAIAPGMIQTKMTATLPEEVRARALQETAVGRLGTPEDVASAVLYLLSDAARHVTGQVLCVDGGQMA